ncbi:hemagglutinin repeat-containing protein [Stenotrophomonas indicatrix]|nr:hemagglutinin repeat-containing protein [Stenotrophomonas indicatrix]QXQ03723.1 hemagglutinin repeat-containing protein [Stenotrophomonas indicatrix]
MLQSQRAEAGIGFKTANSSADGSSTVSRGSTIQGGGNVNLTSTTGDIHVVQGNLSAGNTLSLDSAGDILLEAGKAHVADRSKSSNAGAEVGVGVVVGAQTGVYVYAEASVGSSKANSDSNTWQNTTLTGQNISLKAEGDTTLRGATATADRIDVKTGGTLTIESLQDIAESMSRNSQVGGRVQVAFGNAWNADGYVSAGKAEGSYQGVGQQSGLFAGNGGYHVDAGHVNLIGGAISSTNAANSELTAQTLTFSDLQNQMDYSASSGSISGGAGGKMNGWDAKEGTTAPRGGPGTPMTESGSDSSSTLATLTEGNITIGGKQTTAAELGINTDASAAHRALEALPDASKLLAGQQAMAAAAGTVVSAGQQIRGEINQLIDEAKQRKEDAKAILSDPSRNLSLSLDDRAALIAMALESDRDIERLQKVGVLVSSVAGGLAASTGGAGEALAATLAPAISYQIGQYFKQNASKNAVDGGNRGEEGSATHILAHALLGAAVASSSGNNALVGAIAAGGAEAAAPAVARFLYGKDSKELAADERDVVSAILGAGGSIIGSFNGSLIGVAAGSGAAKNAVDNNWGEVGHYSTMATIIYLANFSEQDAKALALAAWSPDTDVRNAITQDNVVNGGSSAGYQQTHHLLTGEKDPEKVLALQKELGQKVKEILVGLRYYHDNPTVKANILSDPENQRILHAFGDSFAHVKSDGTHYGSVDGHLWDGTSPDEPNNHPKAYAAFVSSLYEIASSVSGSGGDGKALNELSAAVIAGSSEGAQKRALAAAAKAKGSRDAGLVESPIAGCEIWSRCKGNTANAEIDRIYGVLRPVAPVVDWSKLVVPVEWNRR